MIGTRRRFLAGLASLGGLTLIPRGASALTTEQARVLVDGLVGDVNAVINSGISEQAMYARFESIFTRYADVPIIARFCLGPDYNAASQSQRAAYVEAFRGYIARKYGKRFREFIGGRIRVQSASGIGNGRFAVETVAELRGEAPFSLVFVVSARSGAAKFEDMVVEGVSLLKSEAVEVRSMLDRNRGDMNAMTAALRQAG